MLPYVSGIPEFSIKRLLEAPTQQIRNFTNNSQPYICVVRFLKRVGRIAEPAKHPVRAGEILQDRSSLLKLIVPSIRKSKDIGSSTGRAGGKQGAIHRRARK